MGTHSHTPVETYPDAGPLTAFARVRSERAGRDEPDARSTAASTFNLTRHDDLVLSLLKPPSAGDGGARKIECLVGLAQCPRRRQGCPEGVIMAGAS